MAYNDPNDPSSPWYQNADWTDPNAAPPATSNPTPDPYQDIAYWQGKGFGYNDMFDTTTGQMKPGWTRTGKGYEYDPAAANTPPPSTGGPAPAPGSNTGGPKITDPFTTPFNQPPPVNLGGPAGIPYVPQTPVFHAPPVKTAPAFSMPTVAQILSDPGYMARVKQGENSLQNWAAAKGTLADSETGKALTDYGQTQASAEAKNVFDRNLQVYDENYKTQFMDPWQMEFTGAKAEFDPQMTGYSTQAAAGQRADEFNRTTAFQKWLADLGIFQDQRDSTWNKTFQYANT